MNRKIVIIFIIIIIGLVGLISFGLYKLVSNEDELITDKELVDLPIKAVPSDAVIVYFNSDDEIQNKYIPEYAIGYPFCISLHYIGRNTLGALLAVKVPPTFDFLKLKVKQHKKFNRIQIYYDTKEKGFLALYDEKYLIISESQHLLESSLRHLLNNSSVLDSEICKEIVNDSKSESFTFVNNRSLGKLFSGAFNREYLKYAEFFKNLSDWMAFDLYNDDNSATVKGKFITEDRLETFSSVLSYLEEDKSDFYKYLPSTTNLAISLKFTNLDEYLFKYKRFMEAQKRYRDNPNSYKWIKSMDIKQLILSNIQIDAQSENVILLKLGDKASKDIEENRILDFNNQDKLSAVFGNVFMPSAQEAALFTGNYYFIGSKRAINYLYSFMNNDLSVNLYEFLDQTPASDIIGRANGLNLMINFNALQGNIETMLKPDYYRFIHKFIGDNNFNYLFIDLYSESAESKLKLKWLNESLKKLPEHKKMLIYQASNPDNASSKIVVPRGPYKFYNSHIKKDNYLQQLEDNTLILLNQVKRKIKTIPFDETICGYVQSVDFYKNSKKQILFSAGSNIYMMDRLGRMVKDYNVDLGKDVLLGPKVFDFNKKRDYSLLVLHSDNSVAFYDINGKKCSDWNEIKLDELITELPELLTVNGKNFWVIRTVNQMLIYDKSGNIVAGFPKRKRIKPSSTIEIISNSEIELVSLDDKKMILNLDKGTLKRK